MALLIRGGTVIDGTGAPGFTGDILAGDGTVLAMGSLGGWDGGTVDAAGKYVCPGFIDLHRHCDLAAFREDFGRIELAQGITACFAGNCGMAPVPNTPLSKPELQKYLQPCLGSFEGETFSSHSQYAERLKNKPLPLNFGFYAGLGAIKIAVKGFSSEPLSPGEVRLAKAYLAEALERGAFGLSIGLMYVPEAYSAPREIAEIASVMSGKGHVLFAHIRSESSGLIQSVEEAVAIAKMAGVPLQICHFKAAGKKTRGEPLLRAIEFIEKERAAGTDITVDFYPYSRGASTMMQMLPPSFLGGGVDKAICSLGDPAAVEKLRRLLSEGEAGWDNLSQTIGWDNTIISAVGLPENYKFLGMSVTECAEKFGYRDETDFVAALMYSEEGRVSIINRSMSREDIDTIARLPYSMLISDSLYGDMKRPHPRLTGSFPRFLREYSLERGVLPPEEAIRKMTSLPASRIGLTDRGILRKGCRADILVFDPLRFRAASTYSSPAEIAEGLDLALIGGKAVWRGGELLDGTQGRLLSPA